MAKQGEGKIGWTDETDNIIVVKGGGHWCRKYNKLCNNCYAEELNQSTYFGGNKLRYRGQPPELELRRDIIGRWERQRKSRKHFVASMTDVFGEWVNRAWQFEFLDGMYAAPLQTFQVLTKRAGVALKAVKAWMAARGYTTPPKNIWLGFSAGDQQSFDKAWREFKELARMGWTIFVSCEPLLGLITLPADFLALGRRVQVIVGGESGRKKKKIRPMLAQWARWLRDQCKAAGVRFFFKQWGSWMPLIGARRPPEGEAYCAVCHCTENNACRGGCSWVASEHLIDLCSACARYTIKEFGGELFVWIGKKKAGDYLDGVQHREFPEVAAHGA